MSDEGSDVPCALCNALETVQELYKPGPDQIVAAFVFGSGAVLAGRMICGDCLEKMVKMRGPLAAAAFEEAREEKKSEFH